MTLPDLVVAAARHWTDDGHHMWDGGWMWFWGVLMVLAVLAAVGLVVWSAVRSGGSSRGDGTRRARDVLAERYARGELTTEEYHERLDHLR